MQRITKPDYAWLQTVVFRVWQKFRCTCTHSNIYTASVPTPLTAYCKNKQHQPCQHRGFTLWESDSDIHLVPAHTNTNTETHTHTHILNTSGDQRCADTHSRERRGSVGWWWFNHRCIHLLFLSHTCIHAHTHWASDRDTDCYRQARGQVISWQPSSPSLLIWAVGGRLSRHLRPVYGIFSYLTFNTTRPEQVKVYSSPVTCMDLILHTRARKRERWRETVHWYKWRVLEEKPVSKESWFHALFLSRSLIQIPVFSQ